MKKLVFLMTPVLALLLVGCLSSGTPLLKMHGGGYSNSYALTRSRTPGKLYGNGAPGVRFPLSPRSSVSIDVESILDYVQGGSVFTPEYDTNDNLTPWFCFEFAY